MLNPMLLALAYNRKFRSKYGRPLFTPSKASESKWWVHFQRFSKVSKLEDGMEEDFVERLFQNDNDKVLYPYVLSQQGARRVEEDVIAVNDSVQKPTMTDSDYISITLKKCGAWCQRNNVVDCKLKAFIQDPVNQMMAERGNYYLPIFLFSNKFMQRHGCSEEEKLKKASIRAFHPKLYEMLRQSLQDDFND